jgi:hypothetical protein
MNLDILSMLADIRRAVEGGDLALNDWETDFIRNMSVLARAGQGLSDKQDETLEKIWKRATGNG